MAVFNQNIRECENISGRYSFSGQEELPLRHHFLRADGKTFSIIGKSDLPYTLTFSSAPEEAFDIFGRALPAAQTISASSVIYLKSPLPLKITGFKTSSLATHALLGNPGFEAMKGDLEGGMKGIKPVDWLIKESVSGNILPGTGSRSGKFCMEITSRNEDNFNNYIYQELKKRIPGKYVFSAWVKVLSGSPVPYIGITDRDNRERSIKKEMNIPGKTWTKIYFDYDLFEGKEAAVVLAGIKSGTGSIAIDDVSLESVSTAVNSPENRSKINAVDNPIKDAPDDMKPFIGQLKINVPRCTVTSYVISSVPTELENCWYMAVQRGADSAAPGHGYHFTITRPSRVFIFVHGKGEITLPKEWIKTNMTVEWKNNERISKDIVYTKNFPAGTVVIPEHNGQDKYGYGIPHAVAVK